MTDVDPFWAPLPAAFAKDREVREWAERVVLMLEDLRVRGGDGEDLVDGNKTLAESNQVRLDSLLDGSPTYTPSNEVTDRSWDANAAVNGTGVDVADAGPVNVALLSDHDALVAVVQEISDVLATVVNDTQDKGIYG